MSHRKHKPPSAPAAWEVLALLRVACLALIESIWGLLRWPFMPLREEVELRYVDTEENRQLLAGCPAVRTFSCCPWSVGPHSQTFFSIAKFGGRLVPRKELVTMDDGVNVTLLWFEAADALPDVPVVVSLHGIGGDENSVRPIMLAEECLARGWRSVLYVRRGHGESSLLPTVGSTGDNSEAQENGIRTEASARHDKPPEPGAEATIWVESVGANAATAPSASVNGTYVGGGADGGSDRVCVSVQAAPSPPLPVDAPLRGLLCAAGGPPVPCGTANGAPPSPENFAAGAVDQEVLRRTRKAFPQHADTEDLAAVLQHVHTALPGAPLIAVGFSMGSNVLVKHLGEPHADPMPPTPRSAVAAACTTDSNLDAERAGKGEKQEQPAKCLLTAAISVCNGYDIVEGTRYLVSRRPLADRIITAALHRLLRRRLPEVHAICAAHGILVDFDEVLACNTIRDFERALMVPIGGHKDLDEYYSHNNCREALQNVSIPLLCLSARDDPVIDPSLLRYAETAATSNPNVLLAVTKRGGHLGWMQGWRGRPWAMAVIMQYIETAVRLRHCSSAGSDSAVVGGGVAGEEAVAVGVDISIAVSALRDSKGGGEGISGQESSDGVGNGAGVMNTLPDPARAVLSELRNGCPEERTGAANGRGEATIPKPTRFLVVAEEGLPRSQKGVVDDNVVVTVQG